MISNAQFFKSDLSFTLKMKKTYVSLVDKKFVSISSFSALFMQIYIEINNIWCIKIRYLFAN